MSNGKGDTYRTVEGDKFRSNYDAIFGEKEREDEGRVGYFDVDEQKWVEDKIDGREKHTGSIWNRKDCISNAAAIHPEQVSEFNAMAKAAGNGECYNPKTGRPHFTSASHQKRELKRRAIANLDSYS